MARKHLPRLVWSHALQVWCCTDVNYRACDSTFRGAYALWASEVAIRILLTQLEEIDRAHTSH